MRNNLILIVLVASLTGCSSSLYRQSSESDSSSVRSEDNSEKYSRETLREYYPALHDTLHTSTIQQIQVPVYIRERIRETGEINQKSKQETQLTTEQKVTEKTGRSPWLWIAIGGGAVFIGMVVLIGCYKFAKARILSAIPRV